MRIQGPWHNWLAEPLSRDHLVHVYAEEGSLVQAVALFAGVGLGKGEAVVLVAERDHADAVRERLGADGFETVDLERWGRLRFLDPSDLLHAFMVEGMPDAERFRVLVATLVASSRAASHNGRIRVYGEMVNVLFRDGNQVAARRLERLWNEAIQEHRVPLLCTYRVDAQQVLPKALCRAHTHVVPATALD